ncbi:hypothetical protein HPP92_026787 [Vanilla planifolia]|uniref:Myb-like domain-containing protein n=1 Tax=Vanilla planifolia TaxID=51239 RepID=A0A835PEV6_VANPL|nr:hypothetical protein HPP92_026787 [Vanilla planifolia]
MMGDEAVRSDDKQLTSFEAARSGGGKDGMVADWEAGLPGGDDLTPLSVALISPELASAFCIPTADPKTMFDVQSASLNTFSNITRRQSLFSSSTLDARFKHISTAVSAPDDEDYPIVLEAGDPDGSHLAENLVKEVRLPEIGNVEAAELSATENENAMDDQRALKRPRLVWSPQLHKRFVDVVGHLGITNAVPKMIMQLMNVEGLTRENVASHLQKYRLYLKRMQGPSYEAPYSSDHLFASTQRIHEPLQQQFRLLPYSVPGIIPVPLCRMPVNHVHEAITFDNYQSGTAHRGFDTHHPYGPNDMKDSGGRWHEQEQESKQGRAEHTDSKQVRSKQTAG